MSDLTLFDYGQLDGGEANEVRAAAERIRVRMKRTAEDIVAIGQDLTAVKGRLPHGAFLPWIEAEFGMGEDSARNFMRVGERYGKSGIIPDLNPTALYELSAPSTPEGVREEVERRASSGEDVSALEIKRLKREAAEERRRREEAEAERETYRQRADSLADGQQALIEDERQKAREEAKAEVESDLREAREAEQKANARLASEKERLEKASKEAERLAVEKAQAEAESLAAAELEKIEGKLQTAKAEERRAREAKQKISDNIDRLKAKAQEYDEYLRKVSNADTEAQDLLKQMEAVSETMSSLHQQLISLMTSVSDIEYEHVPSIVKRSQQLQALCRDTSLVAEQVADALDGSVRQRSPEMKVVGSSYD